MPISESDRVDLYTGFVEVFGPKRAETMMSAIRINDLDEVATKGDIALLKSELGSLSASIARVDAKLDRLVFILMAGLFGVIATLIGVGIFN